MKADFELKPIYACKIGVDWQSAKYAVATLRVNGKEVKLAFHKPQGGEWSLLVPSFVMQEKGLLGTNLQVQMHSYEDSSITRRKSSLSVIESESPLLVTRKMRAQLECLTYQFATENELHSALVRHGIGVWLYADDKKEHKEVAIHSGRHYLRSLREFLGDFSYKQILEREPLAPNAIAFPHLVAKTQGVPEHVLPLMFSRPVDGYVLSTERGPARYSTGIFGRSRLELRSCFSGSEVVTRATCINGRVTIKRNGVTGKMDVTLLRGASLDLVPGSEIRINKSTYIYRERLE